MKKTLMLTSSLAALVLGADAGLAATAHVEYCSTTTPKLINSFQTTTDSIVVPPGIGTIEDLDVSVDISHTWVSGLVITLDHIQPGTTTTPIDQPGGISSCIGSDIKATFNDEAPSGQPVNCNSSPPVLGGDVTGNDPLSSYDGQDVAGAWTLSVNNNTTDSGTLNEWCLLAEVSSFKQAAACEGFAPPFDAQIGLNKKEQRVIPLRMELLDEDGFPLGPNDIAAPIVSVSYSSTIIGGSEFEQLVESPGKASSGNSFAWDEASQRWAFNLATKPYTAAGTYTVTAVAGDVEYVLDPTCSNTFVRQ